MSIFLFVEVQGESVSVRKEYSLVISSHLIGMKKEYARIVEPTDISYKRIPWIDECSGRRWNAPLTIWLIQCAARDSQLNAAKRKRFARISKNKFVWEFDVAASRIYLWNLFAIFLSPIAWIDFGRKRSLYPSLSLALCRCIAQTAAKRFLIFVFAAARGGWVLCNASK